MQDKRGLLQMPFANYCNRTWLKNQRNYFPVEETDIVKRQAKIPGAYEHATTQVYTTLSPSKKCKYFQSRSVCYCGRAAHTPCAPF